MNMKKYLSSYWKRSCLFCVFIIVATIVTTAIFCSWSSDKEDYILILCVSLFILVLAYLMKTILIVIRYTETIDDIILMHIFGKHEAVQISLSSTVYYEVITLIESASTLLRCVVLSNEPFEPYKKVSVLKLMPVCKSIDKNNKQIIMPYDEYSAFLIGQSNFCKI